MDRTPIVGVAVTPYRGVHDPFNPRGILEFALANPVQWADSVFDEVIDLNSNIVFIHHLLGSDFEYMDGSECRRSEFQWWLPIENWYPVADVAGDEYRDRGPDTSMGEYFEDFDQLHPNDEEKQEYLTKLSLLKIQIDNLIHRFRENDILVMVMVGSLSSTNQIIHPQMDADIRSLIQWAKNLDVSRVVVQGSDLIEDFGSIYRDFDSRGIILIGEGVERDDTNIPWFHRSSESLDGTVNPNTPYRTGKSNFGLPEYWISVGHTEDNGDIRLDISLGSNSDFPFVLGERLTQSFDGVNAFGIVTRMGYNSLGTPYVVVNQVSGTWRRGIIRYEVGGGLTGCNVQRVNVAIYDNPSELHDWYDNGYRHFIAWSPRGVNLLRTAFVTNLIVSKIPTGPVDNIGEVAL